MLPPIDTNTSTALPKFDALYCDLCANKLNADGSSKLDAKALKERQVFDEDLRKARVEAAKRDIVRSGLQDLAYRADELPDELRELVGIAAAALSGQIQDEDKEVVREELERLEKEHATPVARALSKRLQQDATSLLSLLSPDDLHHDLGELPAGIRELQEDIATSRSKLAESRLLLAQQVSISHEIYRQVIQTCVRTLEQTTHGSVARGTKAKADYLAGVAEGMSKKLAVQQGQLMQQVYSAEMTDFLRTKANEMDAESRVLRRKTREAEEKLAEYRQARGMEQMVKEYAEILRETEKVKDEVERLERKA